MNLKDQALKDVVFNKVATAGVLHNLGIDYTSNRFKTIAEVCEETGHNPETVVFDLEKALCYTCLKKNDFLSWTQTRIIEDILERQHVTVRKKSAELTRDANHFYRLYAKECSTLLDLKIRVTALLDDIVHHVDREERSLFPIIKQLETSKDGLPVSGPLFQSVITMIQNHEHALGDIYMIDKLVDKIKQGLILTDELVAFLEEVLGMMEMLRQHIYIEDQILFRKVAEM